MIGNIDAILSFIVHSGWQKALEESAQQTEKANLEREDRIERRAQEEQLQRSADRKGLSTRDTLVSHKQNAMDIPVNPQIVT